MKETLFWELLSLKFMFYESFFALNIWKLNLGEKALK